MRRGLEGRCSRYVGRQVIGLGINLKIFLMIMLVPNYGGFFKSKLSGDKNEYIGDRKWV